MEVESLQTYYLTMPNAHTTQQYYDLYYLLVCIMPWLLDLFMKKKEKKKKKKKEKWVQIYFFLQ